MTITMSLCTRDGISLESREWQIRSSSPKLKAFLSNALNPFRQFQADKLGEEWIQELRGEGFPGGQEILEP